VYERRRGTTTRTIKSIVINENLLYVNLETKIRILLDLYSMREIRRRLKTGEAGAREGEEERNISPSDRRGIPGVRLFGCRLLRKDQRGISFRSTGGKSKYVGESVLV